jgi:hypothetical protein
VSKSAEQAQALVRVWVMANQSQAKKEHRNSIFWVVE